ncbi:MAG TPA: VOC family protein [Polyangiaceae bacterium]|nr:VOC family protein [Polyangiaceae bacterium]
MSKRTKPTTTPTAAPSPKRAATAPRLTVVTLGVSDLARSHRFYCEGLGFVASGTSDEHIVFIDAGGVVLGLYPLDLLAQDAQVSAKGSGFGADLDGYPWEVAYNPHWKLDAEGRVVLPR